MTTNYSQNFSCDVDNKHYNWSRDEVEGKLKKLESSIRGRNWVDHTFDTKKFSGLRRFFFAVFSRLGGWVRRVFFGVDTDRTASILRKLRFYVINQNDHHLSRLFNRAVNKYNDLYSSFRYHGVNQIPKKFLSEHAVHQFLSEALGTDYEFKAVNLPDSQELLKQLTINLCKMRMLEQNGEVSPSQRQVWKEIRQRFQTISLWLISEKEASVDVLNYSWGLSEPLKKKISESVFKSIKNDLTNLAYAKKNDIEDKLFDSEIFKGTYNDLSTTAELIDMQNGEKPIDDAFVTKLLKNPDTIPATLPYVPFCEGASEEHIARLLLAHPESGFSKLKAQVELMEGEHGPNKISKFLLTFIDEMGSKKVTEHQKLVMFSKSLNKGTALKLAFELENFDVCRWLVIDKKADLSNITPLTEAQGEIHKALQILQNPKAITPENLDFYALSENDGCGYGYKSANLMVLQEEADKISKKLKSSVVKVPPFLPIGNTEVTLYLKKHIPQVFDLWNEFKEKGFKITEKDAFLSHTGKGNPPSVDITPEGIRYLEKINSLITNLYEDKPMESFAVDAWLKDNNPDMLIVRSTGKEDSDTNSNAGGNASIPFVKPNNEAISNAIGEVVASYFGEKSIRQRLIAGDKSLFEDDQPFVPVLIQTMIGENMGGVGSTDLDIPRSGVIFSRQQDKADGVTLIQAAYGNNEGVVSSRVEVDSYLVKGNHINHVVRPKTERFVSIQSGTKITCDPIPNTDKAMVHKQAIPNKIIRDIKGMADSLSAYYGTKAKPKALDMEYTVKMDDPSSDKPVVYLLQTRPLIAPVIDVEPSYLDLKYLTEVKAEDPDCSVRAQALVDATASVRTVSSQSEILFVDDLPEGLDKYLKAGKTGKQKDIKVIISKKAAPATSHECVTLRPKGVAVMVISDPSDYKRVRDMAKAASSKKPMLVGTQRGMIIHSKQESYDPDKLERHGLVSYPIPLEVSIPPSKVIAAQKAIKTKMPSSLTLAQREAVMKIRKAFAQGIFKSFEKRANKLIETLLDHEGADVMIETLKVESNKELIDAIGTKHEVRAKIALAIILMRLRNLVSKEFEAQEGDESSPLLSITGEKLFEVYEAIINQSEKAIVPAIENEDPSTLERLYPIKFLEAMLFQDDRSDVIQSASIKTELTVGKALKEAIEQAAAVGQKITSIQDLVSPILMMVKKVATSEQTQKDWDAFMKAVNKLPSSQKGPAIKQIHAMVNQLQNVNALQLWVNTAFRKTYTAHKGSGVTSVLKNLQLSLDKNAKLLKTVEGMKPKLDILEKQVALWGDPSFAKTKNITKLIKTFREELGFTSGGKLQQQFKASTSTGRLIYLKSMHRAFNIYDHIIKSVKGSTQFTNPGDQLAVEAALLEGYRDMMVASLNLMNYYKSSKYKNGTLEYQLMKPSMGNYCPFTSYTTKLNNGNTYNFGFSKSYTSTGFNTLVKQAKNKSIHDVEAQLAATERFNVESLVIGSKSDLNFSAHWPTNLEEYFTTFHQNMEEVVKILSKEEGLDLTMFGGSPRELGQSLITNFKQDISNVEFNGDGVTIAYNIPLRQHSCKLSYNFDPSNPDHGINVAFNLFGNDEHRRWDQASAFASILAHHYGEGFVDDIGPKINYKKPEGTLVTMKLDSDFAQSTELATKLHWMSKTMTMGSHSISAVIGQLESISGFNWNKLDPRAFRESFYINNHLLKKYTSSNPALAGKIGVYSIVGLNSHDMTDYTRGPNSQSLSAYAFAGIKAGLEAGDPEVVALFKEHLVGNDDLAPAFAAQVASMIKLIPSAETLETLIESNSFQSAIVLAEALDPSTKVSQLKEALKTKLAALEVAALKALAVKMLDMGKEDLAKEWVISANEDLDGFIEEYMVQVVAKKKKLAARKQHLTNMTSYQAQINKMASSYNSSNATKLMDLCTNYMIGVSQHSNIWGVSTSASIQFIDKYLGPGKGYDYIQSNDYGDTTKHHKACVAYILKGMESSDEDVRAAAFKTLGDIIEDFGGIGASDENYRRFVFCIMRGYLDANKTDVKRVQKLVNLFKEKFTDLDSAQGVLKAFAKNSTYIPSSSSYADLKAQLTLLADQIKS